VKLSSDRCSFDTGEDSEENEFGIMDEDVGKIKDILNLIAHGSY
jgi:hypothetical protein